MTERRRRRGRYVLLAILALLALAVGAGRWYFSGPRLAHFLISVLFDGHIKGRVEVASIDWPFSSILNRHIRATVTGVRIYDPHGHVTLYVPRLEATVDWLEAALPPHNLTVDDLVIHDGTAFIQEEPAAEPTPEHRYDVSFLSAFEGKVKDLRPPAEHEPGPIILVRSLRMSGMNVVLEMHSWQAYLFGFAAEGTLRQSFVPPPPIMDFSYELAATVREGGVSFAKFHFDLVDVVVNRFGQYPSAKDTLAYSAVGRTIEGADVQLAGSLAHLYDKDPSHVIAELEVDARRGGNLLTRLGLGLVGGGHPVGHIHISGPLSAPRMDWTGRGLPLVQLPLVIDHSVGTLDLSLLDAELRETEIHGLGGRAEAKGRMNLVSDTISGLTLTITEPMSVARWLPPQVIQEAGSELSGSVRLSGVPSVFYNLDRVHLQLGRLGVHGAARLLGTELLTRGLTLTLPEATATVRGQIFLKGRTLALDGDAKAASLGPILARLGLPALAKSASVPRASVRGSFERPIMTAEGTVLGAPFVPKIEAGVTYAHAPGGGRLDVHRLGAEAFGGSVSGSGSVLLGARPRLLDVKLGADGLDLGAVPGLAGTAKLRLAASGPLTELKGSLDAELADLRYAGHDLGGAHAEMLFDERRGVVVRALHVGDTAGRLDLTGAIGLAAPHALDLRLQLADAALALVPAPQLRLAGTAHADLHLGGSLERPTAAGRLGVTGLAFLDTILGSADLALELAPGGRVRFHGRLFQGKLTVDGSVAVRGFTGVDLTARVDFDELELEDFAYDVARRFGAHGWASGYVEVRTRPALVAELHVQRLKLDFEGGPDERLPLSVANQGEIVIAWNQVLRRATLLTPAHLVSPTGGFVVEGAASPAQLALHISGDVQLRLLEPYTRRWLDRARGSLVADVRIGGTLAAPLLDGTVAVKDAAVVPAGQDGAISLPRGSFKLTLNQIQAEGLVVEVDGQRLSIDGRLVLAALRPSQIDLTIRGRVAGKMLEMFAARQITHASGSAAVNLAVRGDPATPSYSGDVTIDQPLELAPRALRRDIVLRTGRIRFSNQAVLVEQRDRLTGTSDEGTFSAYGGAQLDPQLSVAAHVALNGLVHQVPGLLTVELSASVTVTLRDDQLRVSGDLDIVDGRFYAPLKINQFLQSAVFGERTSEEAEPFWKGSPLLANMALDLNVATKKDSFAINNNIAHNVRLDGRVHITGTPPHPTFDGQVNSVGEGTVTIPTLRIREFTVTEASVTFSPYRGFPDETPTAILRADAPFVDLAGTEHQVLLEVTGNLAAINWSLKTSTGLNQIETLSLIWTGRTPDELRARARGDASRATTGDTGAAAQYASPGASSTVAGFADEYLKEFTGDLLASLIEDPVKSIISLDCFSLSVGADSVRASGCKKLGVILQLNGEYEQGIGWYRLNGGLDGRLADSWTLNLQGWTYKPPQEAEGTQTVLRAQVKVHFSIP